VTDWRASAAGAGRDPRWWFTSPAVDPVAAGVARRLCASCPVLQECAREAGRLVADGQPLYGTWAGLTFGDGRAPLRRLTRLAGGPT
jgi:hypothetical protein